ncbi:MDR family oxidoreductase [Parvibium lacunae]|uniref:Oxidoreductase n=1 Tax=Parvibium lacunae TaxID=1888893 RepID=A0A368KZP3_9BURK|nr:MDR family oxidoreductase [Parvibium lacunae]RCS56780.1 oxidoreductase [Parvibium lacunae]
MFKAVLLDKSDKQFTANLVEMDESQLPELPVTLDVHYSSLNYKDALALADRSPVVRAWPMVPGIDLVGTVKNSEYPGITVGEKVLINGFGLGETHWGGLAQVARVQPEWLIPLPVNLSSRQAMAIGTAGYTAALAVLALERQEIEPDDGPILVTGATGGLGSIAIALLAKRGYEVVAATGKTYETDYLKMLGAQQIIDRRSLNQAGKPLQAETYAGVIDSVGSHTLVNACAQTQQFGVVVACGLAQGMDFHSTVAPFILRGISLIGINSVYASRRQRIDAWALLAHELDLSKLDRMTQEIRLSQVFDIAPQILDGTHKGRIVVNLNY